MSIENYNIVFHAVEGRDCDHYMEYKIEGTDYRIRVLKDEYKLEYTKLMTVEEVMEELDKEHGL